MSTIHLSGEVTQMFRSAAMWLAVLPMIWIILTGAIGANPGDYLMPDPSALVQIDAAPAAQPDDPPMSPQRQLPAGERAIKGPVASYVPQAALLIAAPSIGHQRPPGDHAPPPPPSYDLDTTPG